MPAQPIAVSYTHLDVYKRQSYVYCDAQMMEITKAQMELLEGRVPEKANEVVVSEYFHSTYGNNAKIGDTVTLDTESFHGDYEMCIRDSP